MCLISLSLPGLDGFPSCIHFSLDFPPFHAFVVNPKISVLIKHLSRVRANISEQRAATVIGRPLIDPELSISKETIVSLNSIFFSFLNDNLWLGLAIIFANLEESRYPSSKLNSHCLFCWA